MKLLAEAFEPADDVIIDEVGGEQVDLGAPVVAEEARIAGQALDGIAEQDRAGSPLSSWLAEAAASKLRAEALAEFLDGWEAEHGVLTVEELARAERELGTAGSDSGA